MEATLEQSLNLAIYKDAQPFNTQPHPGKDLFTWELHEAIMFGRMVCPGCNGSKRIPTENGRSRDCICQMLSFKLKTLRRSLPVRYIQSSLATWQPSPLCTLSIEKQRQIFGYVSANPGKSYLFYGPPGTGKTTMATALIRTAIENQWFDHYWRLGGNLPGMVTWHSTWIKYINWDELIAEYMAAQNFRFRDGDDSEPPEPSVTTKLIAKYAALGHRPVICIEEIDKSRLTPFKANLLFSLVRAIDDVRGQLIITTNLRSKETFQDFLCNNVDSTINTAGEPTWRRISGEDSKMIRFDD